MGQTMFLQQFCIFMVLLIFCIASVYSQLFDRSPPYKNSFQDTHNSCTRKLLCLIAARNDGNSYENIRLGFNYFYGGYEDREPFRTELDHLNFAWRAGRDNSSEICSNLAITRACAMPAERLMEAFNDIYDENEFADRDNAIEHHQAQDKRLSYKWPGNVAGSEIHSRHSRSLAGMGKRLMKRLRKIKLLGRPFLRPEDYQERAICDKCEDKRSDCFYYYMGTYGLCGGAWAVAGAIGTAACNVITVPRTIDCTINAWFNCHQKNCGFVGF